MTQNEAFDLLKLGYNVFLTGAAGSGKTFLLNKYIAYMREYGVSVAVTASTGIAATHMSGQTIHSWSGIGIRESATDEELKVIAQKDRVRRNFSRTAVLVIDEVSMLHARQLDMVERLARLARGSEEPFGGLQVIVCGDFFQLPPVSRAGSDSQVFSSDGYGATSTEKTFAYECSAWERGVLHVCYLHEQHRQDGDPLLDVLNAIREGEGGEAAKAPLRTRFRKKPEGGVRPTRLYARNINVDAINIKELATLSGATRTFTMTTYGFKALVETLTRSCLAPEKLSLKEGAEVMFVKNSQDGRFVNGTRGKVIDFDTEEGWPVVRTFDGKRIVAVPEEWRLEENGTVRASLKQVPLRLAWAITIHKSQGMTLDTAEIDLSDAFEPGMGYVALSRVRALRGLTLLGLNETALLVYPKIRIHDKKFLAWSEDACKMLAALDISVMRARHDEILFGRFGGTRDKKKVKAKKTDAQKRTATKVPTHEITRVLLEKKFPLMEITKERGLTIGTIVSHLEKLKGLDRLPDIMYLKPPQKDFKIIFEVFRASDTGALTPVFKQFNGRYSFETLRLVRLFI